MPLVSRYEHIVNQKVAQFDFQNIFSNEDDCLELYFHLKFKDCNCVKCGRLVLMNYKRVYRKRAFRCRSCRTYIYPLSNTIFHNSKVPLPHIFLTLFIFSSSRKSVSPVDLIQWTGLSYATAFKLAMQVRSLLYGHKHFKLRGTVEIDEAFIGKRKGAKFHYTGISTYKQPIIGMIERETKKARLFVVPDRNSSTLTNLIRANVEEGSTIYTDAWRGYNQLKNYYNHEFVDHSLFEWKRGDVYTNGVESLWGHMKRNIRKAHIKISDKYINLYLNEACWRHNSKDVPPMKLFNEVLIRSTLPVSDSLHGGMEFIYVT